MEQDFTAVKKGLTDLANLKEAGKAARYAQRVLEQVANCELAKQASKEVQAQDRQLGDTRARIDKAREKMLAQKTPTWAVLRDRQAPDLHDLRWRSARQAVPRGG